MRSNALKNAPRQFGCNKCFQKLEDNHIKMFQGLLFCLECYETKARRQRLLDAEKEFDESPDETIE